MALRFDLGDPEAREEGLAAAVNAVRRCELIVLPTDTVYGLGVDAFEPDGVQRLLDAKGRGRDMPPPVLISSDTTLDALATEVPEWAKGLVAHYWPGPLTIVCRQQPSLRWDLGDAKGTVAVRMPDDAHALELLGRTGPLAVSSANNHGHAAATDADAAEDMLGWATAVILDGGPSRSALASTIVDCTGERPRLLREGAIGREELAGVLGGLGTELEPDEPDEPVVPEVAAADEGDDEDEDLWSVDDPDQPHEVAGPDVTEGPEGPDQPETPQDPEDPEDPEEPGSPAGA